MYLQLTLQLEGAKLQLEEFAANFQQASSRAGNAEARIQVCCSPACFVTALGTHCLNLNISELSS